MFNRETHHHDNSVHFPSQIDIHEHRAPTDDSVRLLNEMQDKALDNLICQVSELRANKFSFNAFFTCNVDTTSFRRGGYLIIKFECNGKPYVRKVKCSGSLLSIAMKMGPKAAMCSLPDVMRRFLLFEMSILIAYVLLDTDAKVLEDLFKEITPSDGIMFDLDHIEEKLQYDYETKEGQS